MSGPMGSKLPRLGGSMALVRLALRGHVIHGVRYPPRSMHVEDKGAELRMWQPLTSWHTRGGPGAIRGCKAPCAAAHTINSSDASPSTNVDGAGPSPGGKKKRRKRLDEAVLELHPEYSRNVVQSFILQGKVLVDGQKAMKSGTPVKPGAKVELIAQVPKYVCRAGLKLEAAFEHWALNVKGKVALDAGLSTGGFTDCLLQQGALRVYGVDVGRGQVAEKLRQDPRLVAMERCNLRHLTAEDLPEPMDIVTLDLSFISVLKVLPAVCSVLVEGGQMVVLIKPQFEAGKEKVSTGGVVKDPVVREEVVQGVIAGIKEAGFVNHGVIESPIKGATSGNTEYVAYFTRER